MKRNIFNIACAIILVTQISYADSYVEILSRCTEQNLNPDKARARNEWAKKCFPKEIASINFWSSKNPVQYALVFSPSLNSWTGPLELHEDCKDWVIKASCVASCYTASQQLLFDSGYLPIINALDQHYSKIVGLEASASLDKPTAKILPVKAYTKSWTEGSELIRVIKTTSGGFLEITDSHPIILSSGHMRIAADVRVGDSLVKANGDFDKIVSIEDKNFYGKVYNVAPDSGNPLENILIAQGFLVGSANYQYSEQFYNLMDRKIMRSLIDLGE